MRGKKKSLSHRKNISKARLGKSWGKHSQEMRNKLSKDRKGHKGSNWKGGVSPIHKRIRNSSQFARWRESVYQRDDWTCQKCFNRGGKLHPHHIFNFSERDELRFETDNGITFCESCHYAFHKRFGYNNNDENQVAKFLDIRKYYG